MKLSKQAITKMMKIEKIFIMLWTENSLCHWCVPFQTMPFSCLFFLWKPFWSYLDFQEIMNYFTYKATKTVLYQLYEMNPPAYTWLYK
jgi:hypothetical protein